MADKAQTVPETIANKGEAKNAPKHPPTADMVNNALKTLNDRGGSSLRAIKKFITTTYSVDADKLSLYIKKYLKSAVANGKVKQTKGIGASGSFKLAAAKSEPKKSVAAKPKHVTGDEKPKAKKSDEKKKSAAKSDDEKKAISPKKAATPSKQKSTKPKAEAKKPKVPKPKTASSSAKIDAPKKTVAPKKVAAPKKTVAPKKTGEPKKVAAAKKATEPKKVAAPKKA